jgi:guanyl-specific ribonuclease Sa
MRKQAGFTFIELILVVATVVLIGFVGVTAYNAHQNATQQASTNAPGSVATTASVPAAPQISSTSDLTAAENTLDKSDIDANTSDSSQLDSQLSSF